MSKKGKLTGADKQYHDEVKLGIATFELKKPRNPPVPNGDGGMNQTSDVYMRTARAVLDGASVAFLGLRRGIMRIVKDKSLELRACPFCGKKAHLMAEDTVGGALWQVQCGYCLCQSPRRHNRQAAIRRWQSRKV